MCARVYACVKMRVYVVDPNDNLRVFYKNGASVCPPEAINSNIYFFFARSSGISYNFITKESNWGAR